MVGTTLVWFCLGILCTAYHVTAFLNKFDNLVNYCETGKTSENCKSEIDVYVNSLTSEKSVSIHTSDHFNIYRGNVSYTPSKNQDQTLLQEDMRPFPHKLQFLKDVKCETVCRKIYSNSDNVTISRLKFLKNGIEHGYHHHWIVDNIPVTLCLKEEKLSYCVVGFPMGCFNAKEGTCSVFGAYNTPKTYYLFNHVDLTITYRRGEKVSNSPYMKNGGQIILVTAVLRSIDHGNKPDCQNEMPLEISDAIFHSDQHLAVTYTYSVKYKKNNRLKWSYRWKYIYKSMIPQTNWRFGIPYSLIIVLFVLGVVAVMMLCMLPISRYKQMKLIKNPHQESDWQLIRGDVFRPPRNGLLLSALLGSGTTVFFITFISFAFACIDLFPPTNIEGLLSCVLPTCACFSLVAGYVSAVIYKSFLGEKWKWNMLLTSMFTPCSIIGLYCIINAVLMVKDKMMVPILISVGSSLGLSIPMTFIGAYFGFKQKALEYPVATNQVPRQIPKQTFFTQPVPWIIMGGILPFACIYTQLFFSLNSLWFGYLLVFFILVIMYSEITILFCYFHLCAENYHWWWRSFLTSGSTAFYMSVYCIYFAIRIPSEEMDATSMLTFFALSCGIQFVCFLLTGSIGFFACFWFVRRIYRLEKDCRLSLSQT